MNDEDLKKLLRESLGPAGSGALDEPSRDLWPEVLRGISAGPALQVKSVPWFDWALAGGLLAFAAAFPAAIPVVLYYL